MFALLHFKRHVKLITVPLIAKTRWTLCHAFWLVNCQRHKSDSLLMFSAWPFLLTSCLFAGDVLQAEGLPGGGVGLQETGLGPGLYGVSLSPSVCLSFHLPLFLYLSGFPSVCLSGCTWFSLSVFPSVWLSIPLYVCHSFTPVCLSFLLHLCLSVFLSADAVTFLYSANSKSRSWRQHCTILCSRTRLWQLHSHAQTHKQTRAK